MKKLFPLMFALVFANQAFAVEPETVVSDETTRAIETDEAIKVEAAAVYNELKKDGLTDAQIVVAVEEKLRNETTQEAYHSVFSKKNQKYIVWSLVGVLATASVYFAGRWAYAKLTAEKKDANKDANKDETRKLNGGVESTESANKGLEQKRAESSHPMTLRTRHKKTK